MSSENSSANKNSQASQKSMSNRKQIIAALESKGIDALNANITESRKYESLSGLKGNSLLSTFKQTLEYNKKKA